MSTDNKDELEKNGKTIRKNIVLVLIPISIIITFISVVQNNSESYLEKKYKEIRNNSYSGRITSLLLDIDKGRTRPILIDNKWKKQVPFFLHEKLNVGDSLYKKTDSDFEYYIRKSKTDTIKRDVTNFIEKSILANLMKDKNYLQ